MNTLKVNNLSYNYGKVEALKEVSFEVKDGLVGILGPNGAGKTTAMKLITTLFEMEGGEVFLNELNYQNDLKKIRQNIGYLPQDFSIYGNLKGREFLNIMGNLKMDCDKKKIKYMEEIALSSGGSKTNKFFLRKLMSLLVLYFGLYVVTFVNIYFLYVDKLRGIGKLIGFKEILLFSFTTNLFLLSLSLFILLISRNIAVSLSLVTAYYLVEEALWRCKVTGTKGILGHIYQYSDYSTGEMYSVRIIYIILSVILLLVCYKISQRKFSLKKLL